MRWLLILSIGLGIVLRLIGLNKGCLWFDEVCSYSVAVQSFPLGIIEKLSVQDVHPPLFFFIFHFWVKIFGASEIALRLFAVMFGILNIPAIYLLGKRFFSQRAGLIAAVLVALNSMQIYYSQEIRFYSLISLLSIISVYFLLKIVENPINKNFILFVVSNIILAYTSTLAPFFILAQALVLLGVFTAKKDFSALKKLGLCLIIGFVLYIPQLMLVFSQMKSFSDNTLGGFENKYVFLTLLFQIIHTIVPVFMSSFSFSFIEKFSSYEEFWQYFIFFIIVPMLTFIIPLYKGLKESRNNLILFVLVALFLLAEIILALSGKIPIVFRYSMFISPILIMIWAYGVSVFKNKQVFSFLLAGSIGVYLVFMLISPIAPMHLGRDESMTKSANIIKDNDFGKNDYIIPLIALSGGSLFLKEYYMDFHGINSDIRRFDINRLFMNSKFRAIKDFKAFVDQNFLNRVPSGSKVAVFYLGHPIYDEAKLVEILKNPNQDQNQYIRNTSIKNYDLFLAVSIFTYDFLYVCEKELNLVNYIKDGDLRVYIFEKS